MESRQQPTGAAAPIDMYLVSLDLPLSAKRYNGIYPPRITVEAATERGSRMQQMFTVYVTITNGKSTDETKAQERSETKPQPSPVLYLESYTVDPQVPQAGEEFTVTAVLRNRGSSKSVKNLQIRTSADMNDLTLTDASDTYFIDKIDADGTAELVTHWRVEPGIAVGKYRLTLSVSGEDSSMSPVNAVGYIDFSVTQPMRVEGEFPIMPEAVNAGDTVSLSFQAVNMGKSAAYNVRFEINVPGLIPGGSAYIGNLGPASSGQAQAKIFIGTKSMNSTLAEGEDEYGMTFGSMVLIYEDESGQEYREEKSCRTDIGKIVITTEAETEPEADPSVPVKRQWTGAIIGGGILIAAGAAGYIVSRRMKHKSAGQ